MYQHFAHVYDAFMTAVPYGQWADYIADKISGKLVLDLGCGTGSMAILMAKKGYDIIAVDSSADMLSEAYAKKDDLDILFLNQDMLDLDLYGTVDAAYSTCDALNYILMEEELEKVLSNVAMFLNPGGIFVFDLKTYAKYKQLGDNTFHDTTKGVSYIWKNHFNAKTGINEYRVQFFFDGKKSRGNTFSEVHKQRAWRMDEVKSLTEKAGLTVLSMTDNYTENPAAEGSFRVTYVCSL